MSTILDAAACEDAQRREDLARNDAAMQAEFIRADIARDAGKGERLAARNDARAVALQQQDLDAMRRAGL